tara:strand:+ start:68 stop:640 length:573 start_codon:yes stop_codon:yes gene_type:complete
MTKKEIRKAAEEKIKSGKTRQESFTEIKAEATKMKAEDIAKIIRYIPTLDSRNKYKTPHTILLILLGISILFKMIAGLPIVLEKGINWLPIIFLLPIINIVLTYGVATYKGQFYKYIGIFTAISLVNGLKEIIGVDFDSLLLIDFSLAGGLIGLGFYLNSKMTSDFKTVKEKYTNQKGQARLRNILRFED